MRSWRCSRQQGESFNALLERAKFGVFPFMSRRHTKRYASEIAFRWNNRNPHEKRTRAGLIKIIESKAGASNARCSS
jgi:hypothetical protein